MKPTSRVLIRKHVPCHVNDITGGDKSCARTDENVLQSAARTAADVSVSEELAPEPLLPNYGVGRIRRYNLDITMMCVMNSRERTLEEFIDIG